MAMSNIRKFYADKTIFVTGGTGFMGKVLVEKLLRTCPELNNIILLIRPKKNLTSVQRMQYYFDDVVFSRVNTNNALISKVQAISGDVRKPKLGLSNDGIEKLNNNVNIFIHSAADVNFGQSLQSAIGNILVGVNSAVELSQNMKNLQAFVHVSSLGASPKKLSIVEEKINPITEDPEKVLKLFESDPKSSSDSLQETCVSNYYSAYSFAKHMAENLIQQKHSNVPTVIFRPGLIAPVYKEPLPGWNNNFYAATGLQFNHATGLLRVCTANLDTFSILIPCDITINALLALTYEVATNKSNTVKVYNYPPSDVNVLTRRQLIDYICHYNYKYPLDAAVFYPKMKTMNISVETLKKYLFFYHTVPAYIIDSLMKIFGQKPRLIRKYKKINEFLVTTPPFFHYAAVFSANKLANLWEKMSPVDRKEFPYNYSKIIWKDYMESFVKGTKIYVLGENMDNLKQAIAKRNRLMVQHYLWKSFSIAVIGGGSAYYLFSLI